MSDILSISSNAVGIYQRVLTTVSDNISNVGNPNYVRQDSSITQLPSQYDGRDLGKPKVMLIHRKLWLNMLNKSQIY